MLLVNYDLNHSKLTLDYILEMLVLSYSRSSMPTPIIRNISEILYDTYLLERWSTATISFRY